jgi:hypothetical protein
VIPKASPFTFRLEGDQTLAVSTGARIAIVEPDQSVVEAGANAIDVADVTSGPDWPMWWLETHPYLVPIPVGWTAHASGGTDPSVFDLVGPHDSMIYVQVPRRVPPLEQMVAHGQELFESGTFAAGDWITVRYTHAAQVWAQRHALVRKEKVTAVVTLQCQMDAILLAAPTHEFVVNALKSGEE